MSERTPVLVFTLVLVMAAGLVLLREPVFQPYRQMADELQTTRDETRRLTDELAQRRTSGQDQVRVEVAYGTPLDDTARTLRATRFYGQIGALASGSGLKVQSLQPRAEVIGEDYVVKLPLQAQLEGDLNALVAFLAQLRASSALVGIERLVITRREREAQALSVQIRLVSYAIADYATRERLAKEREKRTKRRTS